MGHNVQVIAPGHGVDVKWIKNATELADFVRIARERMGQPSAQATSAPDAMEQLKKLAELRDAGVITAEDFETKKSELLKRI